MNINELITTLKTVSDNYYEELNDIDLFEESDILLQKLDNRFIELRCNRKERNFFDKIHVKYVQFKSFFYITQGNNDLSIYKKDLILNADELLSAKNTQNEILLKIYRTSSSEMIELIIDISVDYTYNHKNSYTEFKKTFFVKLDDFDKEFIQKIRFSYFEYESLVLDLRYNTGGSVLNANKLIDKIVKKTDNAYFIKGIDNKLKSVQFFGNDNVIFKNIYILVSEMTASSAELVTAVLREAADAVVIGRRTFGKGVMNKKFEVNEHISLFIPVYRYFTTNSEINRCGIVPDKALTDYEIDRWLDENIFK